MAAVFTVLVLVVAPALFLGIRGYRRHVRRRGWLLNPYLPLVLVTVVLSAYLLAKIAYEEIYPCVAVDSRYCDFDATQYHNLFGWDL